MASIVNIIIYSSCCFVNSEQHNDHHNNIQPHSISLTYPFTYHPSNPETCDERLTSSKPTKSLADHFAGVSIIAVLFRALSLLSYCPFTAVICLRHPTIYKHQSHSLSTESRVNPVPASTAPLLIPNCRVQPSHATSERLVNNRREYDNHFHMHNSIVTAILFVYLTHPRSFHGDACISFRSVPRRCPCKTERPLPSPSPVTHPHKAVLLNIRHVLLPRTPHFMAPTSNCAGQTDFQARLSFWVVDLPRPLSHLIIPRNSHIHKLPVDQQNNDPLWAAHYTHHTR